MRTSQQHTCLCGAELPHHLSACRKCVGTLRGLLDGLPGLMNDLEAAIGRQLRFGSRVGSRSTDTPLPINLAASEAGWVARQTILTWTDRIVAIRGHKMPQTWSTTAAYLKSSTSWISQHADGGQIVDELTAAIRNARRATDRPEDRHYAGLCDATILAADMVTVIDCKQPLYVTDRMATVACSRCGTLHDVPVLHQRMRDKVLEHELTATDAARVLGQVGVKITKEQIWQWRKRGKIETVGADRDGRPLYRIGDLLDCS